MKITSVEPQKKHQHRFNIYLDGEFAFGADEDLIVEQRLVMGKEIATEDLDKLLFEVEVGKLMERMYRLFNIRARSEKEVRDYLKNLSFKRKVKGTDEISDLVVERLIEKLKQKGMVNDEQFARAWVDARRLSKNKGARAIRAELFQKGIDREIIEEVIRLQITGNSEQDLAAQALQKKLRIWKNLDKLDFRKKAIEFLLRRGFEYSVLKDVVEKFLQKR